MTFTQLLAVILGALALFLLVYGLCVRSKTVGIAGAVFALVGGYLIYWAWWGEQMAVRL